MGLYLWGVSFSLSFFLSFLLACLSHFFNLLLVIYFSLRYRQVMKPMHVNIIYRKSNVHQKQMSPNQKPPKIKNPPKSNIRQNQKSPKTKIPQNQKSTKSKIQKIKNPKNQKSQKSKIPKIKNPKNP